MIYRDLSCSPYDCDLLACVHGSVVEDKAIHTASLWRLGPEERGEGVIHHVADLDLEGRNARWCVCVWVCVCVCVRAWVCVCV